MDHHFHLRQLVIQPPQEGYVQDVVAALAAARARHQHTESELIDSVGATSFAAAASIKPVIEAFADVALPLMDNDVPLKLIIPELTQSSIASKITDAVLESRLQTSSNVVLAGVESSDPVLSSFKLELVVKWSKHPHEDGTLFFMGLIAHHDRSPEVSQIIKDWFKVLPDGTVEGLDRQLLVEHITQFISYPHLWQERGSSSYMLVPWVKLGQTISVEEIKARQSKKG